VARSAPLRSAGDIEMETVPVVRIWFLLANTEYYRSLSLALRLGIRAGMSAGTHESEWWHFDGTMGNPGQHKGPPLASGPWLGRSPNGRFSLRLALPTRASLIYGLHLGRRQHLVENLQFIQSAIEIGSAAVGCAFRADTHRHAIY
jgi:hypothetical protein